MPKDQHEDDGNIQSWVDVDEPQAGALETFCFEDDAKEEEWMVAIRHFQHCDV